MQALVSALASAMKMCTVDIKGQTHRPSSSIQSTRSCFHLPGEPCELHKYTNMRAQNKRNHTQ